MTTARDVIAEWLHERYGDCFEHEHADELATLLNQWRPIETAPKHIFCIIWWPGLGDPAIGLQDEQGRWYVDGASLRAKQQPTKWQPLPAPPSEDKI